MTNEEIRPEIIGEPLELAEFSIEFKDSLDCEKFRDINLSYVMACYEDIEHIDTNGTILSNKLTNYIQARESVNRRKDNPMYTHKPLRREDLRDSLERLALENYEWPFSINFVSFTIGGDPGLAAYSTVLSFEDFERLGRPTALETRYCALRGEEQ